jgi:site-specific recombinase XerD
MGTDSGLQARFRRYILGECNLSPATAWSYEQGLRRLEAFIGKGRAEITAKDVRGYLREAPGRPRTKHISLAAIKSFHRWGVLEELWPANGIAALRGPKLTYDPRPALQPAEAAELLSVCNGPQEVRLVYLGLYAGLRIAESASISSETWLPDRLRFMGKGRKVREVPVHAELAGVRDEILARTTTVATLHGACKVLSFRCGLRFSSHGLRRTFAATLVELGVSRDVIGEMLGHAHSITVQAYAPVTWRERVEAIAKLSYTEPLRPMIS